jgi:hypothetical protein
MAAIEDSARRLTLLRPIVWQLPRRLGLRSRIAFVAEAK